MNIKTHTYKEVRLITISIYGDGQCRREDQILWHRKDVINKLACYTYDEPCNFVSWLYDETLPTIGMPINKLFVSSECKTGRDTFRNSNYSITRDVTKADAVVVPDVKASYYSRLSCKVVAKDEEKDELYLVSVRRTGHDDSELEDWEMEKVKKYLTEAMGLVVDDVKDKRIDVWFIPKCEEMEDVLNGTKKSMFYIQESLVPITPSTKISVETLTFWKSIPDKNFLLRTICTSDWMNYPKTVLFFLKSIETENWYNYANTDSRRVLNQVDYSYYNDLGYILADSDIKPKDFEMLQAYAYSLMGLGPEGGMISPKAFEIMKGLTPYLQRRIVLKPLEIPATMSFETIAGLVK